MTSIESDEAIVLTEEDIDHLPTTAFRGVGNGVSHRVLWEQDNAVAGVMRLRAHGRVDPHIHRRAYHDIWMIDGDCEILGRRVTAGSYVHVPARVEHGVLAGGVGCTFLYLYRQPETPTKEAGHEPAATTPGDASDEHAVALRPTVR